MYNLNEITMDSDCKLAQHLLQMNNTHSLKSVYVYTLTTRRTVDMEIDLGQNGQTNTHENAWNSLYPVADDDFLQDPFLACTVISFTV